MENLKIVTIAPITRTAFNDDLTYFTTKEVSSGALVLISLRKKNSLGIIMSVREATELKSDLKTSEFGFKKIEKVISPTVFSRSFVRAVRESAEYFVSSGGQIVKHLTPKSVLDYWQKTELAQENLANPPEGKIDRFEVSVLGLPNEERYSFYRSLVREEFAKKHSIFFILPTIHDVEDCGELLSRGIEEYVTILHGRLTPKIIIERWNKALVELHPILVITTPAFLSLSRNDIATIIIDKENSPFYKSMVRPFIDIRIFGRKMARHMGAKLILGDSIPRVEDIYNAEAGNFAPESPLKYRFPKEIREEIVDMRKMPEENSVLSARAKQLITEAIGNKEQSLLICTRKGLGTETVCSDCGEIILCAKCNMPMVLYRTKHENIFVCNKCGAKSKSDIKCARCGGWKLKVLGIATEKIVDEAQKNFHLAKVFRLDSNLAKSYRQAKIIIDEFEKTTGAILVATEMVLNYINKEVPNIMVISIDTLFAIPDFRINENIFNFLTRLRLLASKNFLIQTRKPDEKIFEYAIRGDLLEFYRNEIKDRKKFEYPPFKTLIKITGQGGKELVNKEMSQLERFLKNYDPKRFNAFVERINNKDRVNILLKIDPDKWPPKTETKKEINEESPYSNLLEILRSLPKRFVIKVEPENIL